MYVEISSFREYKTTITLPLNKVQYLSLSNRLSDPKIIIYTDE